ncbi:N-acetylgalactosaminyl-diphosphoundecaprenol glucuronosyltransferase [Balamuthia mandrillaris]
MPGPKPVQRDRILQLGSVLMLLSLGLAEGGEPAPLPRQAMANGAPSSFSVIVPAHNTGAYVTRTLKSVEDSINYFLSSFVEAKQVKAEVIVVDDASYDNTLSKVMSFVQKRRAQSHMHGNVSWKVLSLPQQVLAGAARNFGVLHSQGEVIFFLDSDDMYHPEHVWLCFTSLARNWRTHSMVSTGVHIELDGIPAERHQQITECLPQNKCLFRNYHDFVEGFPEQMVFYKYNDIGYLKALGALHPLTKSHSAKTVTYKLYPGNSLDKQRDRFTAPLGTVQKHEDAHSPEGLLRDILAATHVQHLQEKADALRQGREGQDNPFWATHSYRFKQAVKDCSCQYHGRSIVDVNRQQMMEFAEEERRRGRYQPLEWAQQVLASADANGRRHQWYNGFSLCPGLFLFS